MISAFSVLSGFLFLTFGIAIALLLGKNREVLASFGIKVIPMLAILALVRVLFPIDLEAAYVIESYTVLPTLHKFLEMRTMGALTVSEALVIVWAGGAGIFLAVNLIRLFRTYKDLRKFCRGPDEEIQRVAAELGLLAGDIFLSPDVVVPISTGFFRPKIYLPVMKFSNAELRVILRHERQHIANGDTWIKLFYMLLAAVLWWHPLVHIFCKKLDDILEYRCDQAVLQESSEAERIIYTKTLLNTARRAAVLGSQKRRFGTVSFLSSSPENTLVMRTHLVLRGKESRFVTKIVTLICVALFIASYFVIWQTAYPDPVFSSGSEVAISVENSCLVHVGDDQYELWLNGIHVDTLNGDEIKSRPFDELEILDKEGMENESD